MTRSRSCLQKGPVSGQGIVSPGQANHPPPRRLPNQATTVSPCPFLPDARSPSWRGGAADASRRRIGRGGHDTLPLAVALADPYARAPPEGFGPRLVSCCLGEALAFEVRGWDLPRFCVLPKCPAHTPAAAQSTSPGALPTPTRLRARHLNTLHALTLTLSRRRSSRPAATPAKRGRRPARREGSCQAVAIGARIGNQCPTTRLWIN